VLVRYLPVLGVPPSGASEMLQASSFRLITGRNIPAIKCCEVGRICREDGADMHWMEAHRAHHLGAPDALDRWRRSVRRSVGALPARRHRHPGALRLVPVQPAQPAALAALLERVAARPGGVDRVGIVQGEGPGASMGPGFYVRRIQGGTTTYYGPYRTRLGAWLHLTNPVLESVRRVN
jgi:hypothetical protein